MRFTIDKTVYSGALDKVKRAVSKSDDDETLKFIYHEATAKGLRLLATDGNIQVEYNVPVGEYLTITEEGKSCPHGQKLSDLIKGFPNVNVEVYNETAAEGADTEMEKFHLCAMKTEKRKVSHWVPCGNKARFPLNDFKLSADKKTYLIDVEQFGTCLKRTQAATSKNLERPFLAHVCIDIGSNEIAACGSDGQRIYYYVSKGQTLSEQQGRFIVYSANIKEFLPLFDDVNQLEIIDDKKILVIKQSQLKFSCRQMDAVEYPDWRNKTNFDGTVRASVNREELTNAIKNILNITDFACTLVFDKQEERVEVLVQPISGQAISGGSDEQVPAVVDADITLGVNPRYLLDALNGSKAEMVTFVMKDNVSPFQLLLGDGFECIITTMMLDKLNQ